MKSEIQVYRELLQESAELFRMYEASHKAKGPGHEDKAKRNADMAAKIEAELNERS